MNINYMNSMSENMNVNSNLSRSPNHQQQMSNYEQFLIQRQQQQQQQGPNNNSNNVNQQGPSPVNQGPSPVNANGLTHSQQMMLANAQSAQQQNQLQKVIYI